MSTQLMILSGWTIETPPDSLAARQRIIDAMASVEPGGEIPDGEIGQMIAEGMAAEMQSAEAYMAEVERISKELRTPYRTMADRIKETSDNHVLPVVLKWQALGRKLGDFEARKSRAEIAVNQLRSAAATGEHETELARIAEMEPTQGPKWAQPAREELDFRCNNAQAPELFKAPVTAGVSTKRSYNYEVGNQRKLAEWCWANGKTWVNEISFFKRDIIGYLNSEGDVDRNIPGLAVVYGIVTKTKRTRTPKVAEIIAETRSVEL